MNIAYLYLRVNPDEAEPMIRLSNDDSHNELRWIAVSTAIVGLHRRVSKDTVFRQPHVCIQDVKNLEKKLLYLL